MFSGSQKSPILIDCSDDDSQLQKHGTIVIDSSEEESNSKRQRMHSNQQFGSILPDGCWVGQIRRCKMLDKSQTSSNMRQWCLSGVSISDLLVSTSVSVSHLVLWTFLFEPQWLTMVLQDSLMNRSDVLKCTIIHGISHGESQRALKEWKAFMELNFHVSIEIIAPPKRLLQGGAFALHHTKMAFVQLKNDDARLAIFTANLIERDWSCKTQMAFVTPWLQKKDNSLGQFGSALDRYLMWYDEPLSLIRTEMKAFDWSGIRAKLIGHVPGRWKNDGLDKFGWFALVNALESRSKSPLIVQCSSIGSLNKTFMGMWMKHFDQPKIQLVFPSVEDVRTSSEGYEGGDCLPYRRDLKEKNQLSVGHLLDWHRWRADYSKNTKSMPHCKTYLQGTKDQIDWWLVTSANFSQGAWGRLEKNGTQIFIMHYELGVLIQPSDFGVTKWTHCASEQESSLPVPFDLPLVRYEASDQPWVVDDIYTKPDCLGKCWPP